MYLKFSKFLRAGRLVWKCSGKGDRLGYEMSGFDPGLRSSLFLTEKLSITGQKCLKNGSNFLRREICFTGPVPDRCSPLQISVLIIHYCLNHFLSHISDHAFPNLLRLTLYSTHLIAFFFFYRRRPTRMSST